MDEEAEDKDEEEFARACGIVCDVHTKIFRNILQRQIPPGKCADVANKIRNVEPQKLSLALKIDTDGNYDACDISFGHLLLALGCPQIPCPTGGWGAAASTGTTLGDDIQRMWDMTKYILNRFHARSLERGKYIELTTRCGQICKRIDLNGTPFLSSPSPSCEEILKNALESPLNKTVQEKYLQEIKHLLQTEEIVEKEKEYFAKMCQVVMDLNPLILQDILDEQLSWNDCPKEAETLSKLKHSPIKQFQVSIAQNVPQKGYTECDTSLMYIFLRNLCKKIQPPTPRWGEAPTGIQIADDIERIRLIRNRFGHAVCARLCSTDYSLLMSEMGDICQRFDQEKSHSSYTKQNRERYSPKLQDIVSKTLDIDQQEVHIKKLFEMNERERDSLRAIDDLHNTILRAHEEVRTDLEEIKENQTRTLGKKIKVFK